MDRSLAQTRDALALVPQDAPPVEFPDAAPTPGGRRLAAMLARVPGFDWCHWEKALAGVTLDEVAGALRFAHEGVARTRLATSEEADVALAGWLPGQSLAPEAHGASEGFVHILGGRALAQELALEHGTIRVVAERTLWAGDRVELRPEARVRLSNPGPAVLVTLHLYAPGLR